MLEKGRYSVDNEEIHHNYDMYFYVIMFGWMPITEDNDRDDF